MAVLKGVMSLYNCEMIIILYIQFIDWFFTCLYLYVFLSIWNIVAGISLIVLQEVITLYDCEIIFILYSIHWLIFYLLRSLFIFFFLHFCIIVRSWYVIGCFTRSDPFVWLWNDYYFISSSLIDCLLALICMLFLIICIIVASMFLAVLQEVISLHILFCLLILDLLRYMLLLIYMNHHSWYV